MLMLISSTDSLSMTMLAIDMFLLIVAIVFIYYTFYKNDKSEES